MKLHLKSWGLLALTVVLLLLNLVDQGTGQRLAEQLPGLSAVERQSTERIEISSAVEKVIIERQEVGDASQTLGGIGKWHLTGPIQAEADQMLVRSILSQFRKEVPIDIKVDEGNLEDYGLDATNGIVLEIWEAGPEPTISFTLGYDAPGGSTFVRLSGDDAIYRARVGGRHRYERRATDWRNAVLLDVETSAMAAVTVTQKDGEGWTIVRGDSLEVDDDGLPVPGDWVVDPDPGWDTDHLAIEAALRTMGHMRAGDLLDNEFDGGFEPPLASVSFTLTDGSTKTLDLGTRPADGGAYVRVSGRDGVFRVALSPVRFLMASTEDLRNKTLFRIERSMVDTVALEEDQQTILLQQDLSNGLWRLIQPTNMDIDLGALIRSVRTLTELRAHEISEVSAREAGLDPASGRIVLTMLDGSSMALAIGGETRDSKNRPAVFVRVEGERQVWLLRDTTIATLKQGFGRG